MADTKTNQQKFQELRDLFAIGSEGGPPDASVSPPSAPSVSQQPGSLLDNPQDRALFESLTRPKNIGAAPEVEKKSMAGSIFRMLGDALATYSSILGRTEGGERHSFQKYLASLDKQKADLRDYEAKKSENQQEADLRGLQFLGGRSDARQQKADEVAALAESRAYQRQVAGDEAKARNQERAENRAAELEKFNANKAWDMEMEKIRNANEMGIAGIRKRIAQGDKDASEDKKAMGPILGTITAMSLTAKQHLAEGKTTPEALNGIITEMIDEAMLSPEARAVVEGHFNVRMGETLREFSQMQMNQSLAAGSPEGNPPPGILERMGPVRVPQKF